MVPRSYGGGRSAYMSVLGNSHLDGDGVSGNGGEVVHGSSANGWHFPGACGFDCN